MRERYRNQDKSQVNPPPAQRATRLNTYNANSSDTSKFSTPAPPPCPDTHSLYHRQAVFYAFMQTVNGLQPPLPLLLYLPAPTLCHLKRFHSPVPAYCCHVSPAAVSADCSWWTITKSGHQDIRESGTCMLCSAEACDADSQCVPCGRDVRIAHHLQRERERERTLESVSRSMMYA